MATVFDSLRIMIVSMGGEQPLGAFSVNGNQFSGEGTCGTRYDGTFAASADGGADVSLTATIPKGARLGSQPPTTEERRHAMKLHLTPEQAEGTSSADVLLPGFGRARLRFVRE